MRAVLKHQEKLAKVQHKFLSTIMGKLGIKFSTDRRAVFGMNDFIAMTPRMTINNTFAPTAAVNLEINMGEISPDPDSVSVPSDDWFLGKLRDLAPAKVANWCGNNVERMCALAKKAGMIRRGCTIALDATNIPYYGKYFKDKTIKTKPKSGTARFFSYMVAHTTDQKGNMPIGCMRITKDDNMTSITHKMLKKMDRVGARPGLVLADRGFYSVDWINFMKRDGRKFVMPAVKNPRIKKAILEHHEGKRDAASTFTMSNKDGEQARFNLLIVEKDGDKKPDKITDRYVVFATNLPCRTREELIEELPETYRNRWIVETGFRMIKDALGKTCSRTYHVRLFLFHVALMLYGLWRVVKFTDITFNHEQAGGDDYTMDTFVSLMGSMTNRQITWQRLREDSL